MPSLLKSLRLSLRGRLRSYWRGVVLPNATGSHYGSQQVTPWGLFSGMLDQVTPFIQR